MKTVGVFEAKTHFSALVEEASKGETITVTKNGRAVAQ
ncbi:MAG: type II toxin-antitoxin system prevent-host-death family antitoxin, partial [Candidatus Eremiobacteraeota bacterium]|nr:type II toxin-antitoxin system prevent-host-death family antitoxin [Candidatus Eremiobacteraeota bacterium]